MLTWWKRLRSAERHHGPTSVAAPARRWHAIGDLFWELELPADLLTGHLETGPLLIEDPGNHCYRIEISGITVTHKDPRQKAGLADDLRARARKAGIACTDVSEQHTFFHQKNFGVIDCVPHTYEHWFAALGNREAIITISYADQDARTLDHAAIKAVVEHAIRSLRLTHEYVAPHEGPPTLRSITPSQSTWLADLHHARSERIRAAVGIGEGEGYTLADVDTIWSQFISNPPQANDEVSAVVNGVAVTFAEFLIADLGFEWAIITDAYGTCIGIVALRETARVTIDPFNFVAKRWDRREPRFLVDARESIRTRVAKAAADWRK